MTAIMIILWTTPRTNKQFLLEVLLMKEQSIVLVERTSAKIN